MKVLLNIAALLIMFAMTSDARSLRGSNLPPNGIARIDRVVD
jgi:hypothetical protein